MEIIDIQCPYCRVGNYITKDDGFIYEDNKIYFHTCDACEKIYKYYSRKVFDFFSFPLPCQEGKPHKLITNGNYCEYCEEIL